MLFGPIHLNSTIAFKNCTINKNFPYIIRQIGWNLRKYYFLTFSNSPEKVSSARSFSNTAKNTSQVNELSNRDFIDRNQMLDLIKKQFYYDNSFDIYGGITGQNDFGPLGCEIIDNIISQWNKQFVVKENMLKINTSTLTPEIVLETSGHVKQFTDFVIKDAITGDIFRLDHLIKQHFEQILTQESTSEDTRSRIVKCLNELDGMDLDRMGDLVKEFGIKSPLTGNELSEISKSNLMFPIVFGFSGNTRGYLRPETAQGTFVNFQKLHKFNGGKLPFACAQVGPVYRNEISPKSGLLRMREFTLAEIEHFSLPNENTHPKYHQISDSSLRFFSAKDQEHGQHPRVMTISEAMQQGILSSQILAYYLARIQEFLLGLGVHPDRLRFRQHSGKELAHYASDCWDAECFTSYGWIECVGCADRTAYDLIRHSEASGCSLSVDSPLPEPIQKEVLVYEINKRQMKDAFGEDSMRGKDLINDLSQEQILEVESLLEENGTATLGNGFIVTRNQLPRLRKEMKMIFTQKLIPNVTEPSFGIHRIFYVILEHCFRVRKDDKKRTYFSLPSTVAPFKVAVLPVIQKPQFMARVQDIAEILSNSGLPSKTDDSRGSMGRRYVKMDEMGIPFCVTVDERSLSGAPDGDSTVTVRERDTCSQIRLPIVKLVDMIEDLLDGKATWSQALEQWPLNPENS